jgi:DNA ligase-4
MFHITNDARESIQEKVDGYDDSYARDVMKDELKRTLEDMILPKSLIFSPSSFLSQLEEHCKGLDEQPGSMIRGCVVCFTPENITGSKLELELRITRF